VGRLQRSAGAKDDPHGPAARRQAALILESSCSLCVFSPRPLIRTARAGLCACTSSPSSSEDARTPSDVAVGDPLPPRAERSGEASSGPMYCVSRPRPARLGDRPVALAKRSPSPVRAVDGDDQ
jgi:hypothetical protein